MRAAALVGPGARLGPYEIVAPLGAGGMGEVYRARDTRLGREVAVKVLPAPVARDPDRLARFEREARLLASLSHPNLLAIHDFGREADVTYAVTELLEGETLRQRLLRERLPWRRVLELTAGIADGLAAAHGKGIVHRDLKPENLFLTADGRVTVLDFGLARESEKALADQSTLTAPPPRTQAGAVLGTVGYMAPEQVRGEPADPRSDIFALGCVLYEMLSGRRAFSRDTAAETLTAILREPVPELPANGAALPAELHRIVARCLEKHAGERFQSASDLAFALRSLVSGPAATGPPAAKRPSRRQLLLAGAALAAAAVAVLLVGSPWREKEPAAGLEPRRIVVVAFENQTGEASLDALGRMAADWITQGLAEISEIEAVPTSVVLDAEQVLRRAGVPGPQRDPLAALAERCGAATVISGSYYAQGPTLRFETRISDATSGVLVVPVEPAAGDRDEPMKVLDELRERVLGVVAARFGSPRLPQLGLVKPPLFAAYREYIAGLELFADDYPEALRHLQRAAELDPEFMSPQFWLIAAYTNLADFERAESIVQRLAGRREQLTPFERHMVDFSGARLAGRGFDALQALRRGHAIAPLSNTVGHLHGFRALACNLPRETVDTVVKLVPWGYLEEPGILGSWRFNLLGEAYHMLGDYERELELADRAVAAFPQLLTVRVPRVRALAALGRLDQVDREVDECLTVRSRAGAPAGVVLQAAWELRAHGHPQRSVELARRTLAFLRSHPPAEPVQESYRPPDGIVQESSRRLLPQVMCAAEQWDEAQEAYEELARLSPLEEATGAPTPARHSPDDVPASVRAQEAINTAAALGVLAARRGDRDTALRVAARLAAIDRPYLFGTPTYWRARIAAQLDDPALAVSLLREAISQGYQYGAHLHNDPNLEPLWSYPPFVELLRPKG